MSNQQKGGGLATAEPRVGVVPAERRVGEDVVNQVDGGITNAAEPPAFPVDERETNKDSVETTGSYSAFEVGSAESDQQRVAPVDQEKGHRTQAGSIPLAFDATTSGGEATVKGTATEEWKSANMEATIGLRNGGVGGGNNTPAVTDKATISIPTKEEEQEEDGGVGGVRRASVEVRNSRNSGGLMSATIVALRRTPQEIIEKQRVARRSRSNSPMNPSSSSRSTPINNNNNNNLSASAIISSRIGQDVANMLDQQSPTDDEEDDDDDNNFIGLHSNQNGGGQAPVMVGAMAVPGAPSVTPKTKTSAAKEDTSAGKKGGGRNSYLSYLHDDEDQRQQQQQQQQQPEMPSLARHQSDPGAFHEGGGGGLMENSDSEQQSDPGAFHSGEFSDGGAEMEQAPNLDEETRNRLADLFPSLDPQQADDQADDSSAAQLSVAMLIDSEELADLETATQVSEMDFSRRSGKSFSESVTYEGRRWLPWIILALVLLVALMLGCFFLGLYFGEQRATIITVTATPLSTSSPSASPTAAPTGSLDLLRKGLPQHTLASLESFDTPQWKAWNWLENHPDLAGIEEWRKKQLFTLVTFYYSMAGEDWPQVVKDNWLLYDRSECFWFDSAFGEFNEDTGLWEVGSFYDDDNVATTVCNELEEFQILDLVQLELAGKEAFVPPEIALLSSLVVLSLSKNEISAPIRDFLPSELYNMPNFTQLVLFNNSFTGWIPSELGKLSLLNDLQFFANDFSGQIPSELGLLTRMTDIDMRANSLTGSIPTELGFLTSMIWLWIMDNNLSGVIPTELGRMSVLKNLELNHNMLSGSLPSELALLSNSLADLRLENNFLSGTIPPELESLKVNGSLISLSLANNSFVGTIPEGLCSLGLFDSGWGVGLSFDCNDQLCGCCWCPCPGSNYSDDCDTRPFVPSRDVLEWPGAFPFPLNRTNAITVNIHTDRYPEETTLEWSVQDGAGVWKLLESEVPSDTEDLHSYTYELSPDSIYSLQLLDEYGDGNCCDFGFGWVTITNSIPSTDYTNGTVIWEAAGYELGEKVEAILSIDSNGQASLVASLFGNEAETEELEEAINNSSLAIGHSGLTSSNFTDD